MPSKARFGVVGNGGRGARPGSSGLCPGGASDRLKAGHLPSQRWWRKAFSCSFRARDRPRRDTFGRNSRARSRRLGAGISGGFRPEVPVCPIRRHARPRSNHQNNAAGGPLRCNNTSALQVSRKGRLLPVPRNTVTSKDDNKVSIAVLLAGRWQISDCGTRPWSANSRRVSRIRPTPSTRARRRSLRCVGMTVAGRLAHEFGADREPLNALQFQASAHTARTKKRADTVSSIRPRITVRGGGRGGDAHAGAALCAPVNRRTRGRHPAEPIYSPAAIWRGWLIEPIGTVRGFMRSGMFR